ncbi:hypothetical protein FSARC_13101 [Fusarium sarcochroum]|uniref:Uncharacterized protein n=1 Tax=Fusarium sarcochroum TaxID=1208366 RepID=A0A8H4WUX6_9HYPO|nr:hypothetical protein FSARC_13101 [Fusarium sarcochroum]
MNIFSSFPLLLTACASAVLSSPVLQERQDPVDPNAGCSNLGDFVDSQVTVGNDNGGGYICVAKWRQGIYPKEIQARADNDMLRWIRVVFTDGSEQEAGQKVELDSHNREAIMKWDPFVDSFALFNMYNNGWGGGLGRLVMKLKSCSSDDCIGDAGAWNPNGELTEVPHGVDNDGVLLGFAVRHGDGIDSLTPIFSKTAIEAVTLKDATFDPTFEQLNEKPFSERQMEALQQTHLLDNRHSKDEATLWIETSIDAQVQHKVIDVHEKGTEKGYELGITALGKVSWKIGRPAFFAGGEGEFNLEGNAKYQSKTVVKDISGTEDTDITDVRVGYRASHLVSGGGVVQCQTTVIQSRANLRFTATLNNLFKDGTSFEYRVTGILYDANHSEAGTVCNDVDPGKDNAKEAYTVITESGTYCPDGTKVSDVEMSEEEYNTACPILPRLHTLSVCRPVCHGWNRLVMASFWKDFIGQFNNASLGALSSPELRDGEGDHRQLGNAYEGTTEPPLRTAYYCTGLQA